MTENNKQIIGTVMLIILGGIYTYFNRIPVIIMSIPSIIISYFCLKKELQNKFVLALFIIFSTWLLSKNIETFLKEDYIYYKLVPQLKKEIYTSKKLYIYKDKDKISEITKMKKELLDEINLYQILRTRDVYFYKSDTYILKNENGELLTIYNDHCKSWNVSLGDTLLFYNFKIKNVEECKSMLENQIEKNKD